MLMPFKEDPVIAIALDTSWTDNVVSLDLVALYRLLGIEFDEGQRL